MQKRSRVMIDIPPELHYQMRELALRRRHTVALEYKRALELYLSRIENYLGKSNFERTKDNGKEGRKESNTSKESK